ncbi:MAG: hypothetical protein RL398_3174 [Planctomycetota bacterium]|jgi:hypothetical protein
MVVALLGFGAACATADARYPAPLPSSAAEVVSKRLAAFGEPQPGGLYGPGDVDLADGGKLPYDRFLLVGSELGRDRGESFAAFLHQLRELGGSYVVLAHRQDGTPIKVLLSLGERRIVAAMQQW